MSFLKLSDELLLQIFTLSKHFEPSSDWAMKMKDLRNIILTCSRFYRVGQDVLYRQMDLGSGKPLYSRFNNFLDTITVHPTRASSVRKVTFSWSGRDIKEWELVFDIIIRLPLIHTVELFVCRGSTAEPRHFHLSHFLDRCFDVPIQNLVIWDHYITSEDIGKLSVIRNVKNLKISLPDKDVSAEKLIVPSTGGHCNMVKLYFSSVNLPPKKVCISSILKQYPGLQELTWDYTENSAEDDYFSPTEFISALLPIHATLVKLNLAITPESSHSSQLDFSQFTALKVLRVYERLMFQFNRGNQWALELHSEGEIQGDRLRLSERLPATLERLDVSSTQRAPKIYPLDLIFTNMLCRSYFAANLASLNSLSLQAPITSGSLL
jgi:hypothetical protein